MNSYSVNKQKRAAEDVVQDIDTIANMSQALEDGVEITPMEIPTSTELADVNDAAMVATSANAPIIEPEDKVVAIPKEDPISPVKAVDSQMIKQVDEPNIV